MPQAQALMATPVNDCSEEQVGHLAFDVGARRGGVEIIDELADEWRDLSAEAADDQIFYRPEFIRAHIRAMLPAAKLLILTVRKEGRLLLLLPLVQERSTFGKIPVRRLRAPVDAAHCGRFDAVRRIGPEGEAAIFAVWQFLKDMEGWDLLHLRYALPGSTIGRLFSNAQAEGFLTAEEGDRPNPYVPVPSDPGLLAQMPRSSRLRTKLRSIRKRIAEHGSARFYCVEKADPQALDRVFALEASGWKGRAGTAVNCDANVRRFFNELADSAASIGALCLYMLELHGELIAAHYSLTYRHRCHSPIVAFDERFKEFAPGHLIVSEILRDCVNRGIVGYDITGEDQEWKMKWTSEALAVNHYFVFKGPVGQLAYRAGVQFKRSFRRFLPVEMR